MAMSLLVPLRKKKPNPHPTFSSTLLIDLLPGEITVAQATKAQQVLYFSERSGCANYPVSGTLLCTNRRISFVPDTKLSKTLPHESGRCLLDASLNVPLSCVDKVNILGSKTKKVLDGVSTLPKHISQLQIVCKDVRKLHFSLKTCPDSEASSLVNAIGRHTHPNSVHLLFAYDYTRAVKDKRHHDHFPADMPQVPSFLNARDWQRELLRLGVTNDQWRVSEANKHFLVCDSMCPYFPCPTTFPDSSLEAAAGLHSNNRIPVWCWSHPQTGVSLTRGGTTTVEDETEAPDPSYRVSVAMARHTGRQVENKGVRMVDVLRKCGAVKRIRSAFRKLRDLCMPGSGSDLGSLDKHWYSSLESSGWLHMVRAALIAAKEVTHLLCIKRRSVMLLEDSGCDLSCVVSSLVELMADPHYRTISGFESLVQKEWVALGHPFTTRHGLTAELSSEEDKQEAPVFLLFLDCVWQLSRQFPSAFEFSEFFLLQFYEMVLDCLYNNFLYNSTKHRLQASLYSRRSCFFGASDEPLEIVDDYEGPLFSAWGRWREAMNEEENERCLNPLYYVFGSVEIDCEGSCSSPLATQFSSQFSSQLSGQFSSQFSGQFSSQLSNILLDSTSSSDAGRHSSREVTPVSTASQDVDYYRQGLLVPETSLCSLKVWSGFFFRHLPELGECHQTEQKEVQQLESRMVRDVQKLKEELNEVELSLGTFTTDLPSCVGQVVMAREKEILDDRRESVEVGVPLRPRLTASVYSYSEIEDLAEEPAREERDLDDITPTHKAVISEEVTPVNSPHTTPTKLQQPFNNGAVPAPPMPATKQTSLAQFTDALYSSELQVGGGLRPTPLKNLGGGEASPKGLATRSPVTKTRLRVVKTKTADPVVAAWQQSSPRQVSRSREMRVEMQVEPSEKPPLATDFQLTDL